MSEHDEQVALFEWAILHTVQYPELEAMFAIPNGAYTFRKLDRNGRWYSSVAKKLVREGLKKGVPDIFLAVPRGKYHGLFIELKFGQNRLTPEQIEWFKLLTWQGYRCVVCYGWQEASQVILDYLEKEEA